MGHDFNLEYEGRAFEVGYGFDTWLYHLGYLATQEADNLSWLSDWGKYTMQQALEGSSDYAYEVALLDLTLGYTDKTRIALLIELSRKVLARLQNYEQFLEIEIPKWKIHEPKRKNERDFV
jgi:hypothetical protein